MPKLEALQREHGAALDIVAVNMDDPAAARALWDRAGYTMTLVRDDGPTSQRFHVATIPHTVVIHRDGRVAGVVIGSATQVEALVRTDVDWVPSGGESSLYLRPFMFASESFLGVRPAQEVTYCVIASPAGAYFSGGVSPVSIWLSTEYTRAAPGGTGAAKCGGNYAASLAPQQAAFAHGCEQVCFLDAAEQRWVEELGGMNLYFVHADGTLVTPELTGTILEGVTRSSILTLSGELGLRPQERRVSIDEWRDGIASGAIAEVFACGTAAVVTPLGRLAWDGGELVMGTEPGPVTMRVRQALLDVQHGRATDTHGWLRQLA